MGHGASAPCIPAGPRLDTGPEAQAGKGSIPCTQPPMEYLLPLAPLLRGFGTSSCTELSPEFLIQEGFPEAGVIVRPGLLWHRRKATGSG
ncbi:hypothetical protein J1605_012152 [Eschrichtius robustus]|uniref:Uncharacterized protein n=1 Tax=Eschrichtius robustus TaxID=9764 RepID=A0AB34GKV0_ESCRO|nr:hypothetical protein J1605_012152 [Eschrichtius robustus]